MKYKVYFEIEANKKIDSCAGCPFVYETALSDDYCRLLNVFVEGEEDRGIKHEDCPLELICDFHEKCNKIKCKKYDSSFINNCQVFKSVNRCDKEIL